MCQVALLFFHGRRVAQLLGHRSDFTKIYCGSRSGPQIARRRGLLLDCGLGIPIGETTLKKRAFYSTSVVVWKRINNKEQRGIWLKV
jgi:hypothetical protein